MGWLKSAANIVGRKDPIKSDDKGSSLIGKLDSLYSEAKTAQKDRNIYYDSNDKLYTGNHWDEAENRPDYKSRVIINMVFMAVETITPIMTDREPIMIVEPKKEAPDPEKADLLADQSEHMLHYHWDRLDMQVVTPAIVRHMLLNRDAILHWYWDTYTNDVGVELLDPKNVYTDPSATKPDDVDYVIKAVPRSIRQVKQTYPKLKTADLEDLAGASGVDDTDGDEEKNSQVLVKEFWGWVQNGEDYEIKKITWIGNKIVANESNPNFKKGDEEKYNHFDKEALPFIFIPSYQHGDDLYSKTSAIEQAKELQYNINQRKAQITDNANDINNPQRIVAADSGIDLDLWDSAPGTIIEGGPDISSKKVRILSAAGLPNFVREDLEDSMRAFDNIFGTHDISRGVQVGTKSATESQLLKEADQGRIALLIRNFNYGIAQLGNAWLHLMKMNYTETHYGRYMNEDNERKYIQMTRDKIPDSVEVSVKVGSNLPIDRLARRAEAQELWASHATTPNRLAKELDMPKADNLEDDIVEWEKKKMEAMQPPMPEGPPEMPPGAPGSPEGGVEGEGVPITDMPASLIEGELEEELEIDKPLPI